MSYILGLVKKSLRSAHPTATVILYGSYARGDYRDDSDIDILVLLDIDKDKLDYNEKKVVRHPIYDIGLEADVMISPKIYTRKGWEQHRATPYVENVNREGIVL
jgi:predicted nucleotidyltransferase